METTHNLIDTNHTHFLKNISQYLETPLYFYGSIQRTDYIPNHSDIDIDIFSNDEILTMLKLQQHLHLEKKQFNPFVYKIYNNKVVRGHKIKYVNEDININLELSIYNEKDKSDILVEHNRRNSLPFYVSFFLIIAKLLYYKCRIIPYSTYRYIKDFLMSFCIDGKFADFVVI